MKPSRSLLSLTTLVVLVAARSALAQSAAAPAAAPAPPPNWLISAKTPTSWLTIGGDLRIRDEHLDSVISLNEHAPRSEQNWIRFRGRVWATATLVTNIDFNFRLVAEPREYTKPSFHAQPISGWDWTEGLIDNLNFKVKQPFGLPMTLTVGRQDIMLGDFWTWWLMADGTPLDGSRSYFLDAARVTYELKDLKTTVDAIYIEQSAMNDAWLPPINHLEKPLTEQNERGVVLWLSNKSLQGITLNPFFMYKHDEYEVRGGDNADLYTFGTKISGDLGEHWKYSLEGAYQLGWKEWVPRTSQSVEAFGWNNRLTYLLKDSLNTQFRMSHEFLSGDESSTADVNEQFDVLWGRWPRWSELYIYSYIPEQRPAQNGNLHRFGPGFTLNPHKKLTLSADYNALFADEPRDPSLANSGLFGSGYFRGHYVQSFLRYTLSKHFNAHLWGEWVFAGDYYTYRDTYSFIRAEIYFTW